MCAKTCLAARRRLTAQAETHLIALACRSRRPRSNRRSRSVYAREVCAPRDRRARRSRRVRCARTSHSSGLRLGGTPAGALLDDRPHRGHEPPGASVRTLEVLHFDLEQHLLICCAHGRRRCRPTGARSPGRRLPRRSARSGTSRRRRWCWRYLRRWCPSRRITSSTQNNHASTNSPLATPRPSLSTSGWPDVRFCCTCLYAAEECCADHAFVMGTSPSSASCTAD